MPTYDEIIVTILFFTLLFSDYLSGVFKRNKRKARDWLVDAISFIQLATLKPLVMLTAFYLVSLIMPESKDSLSHLPFWLAFLVVFVPDDFMHYWIHRLAHHHPKLWPFHRSHHTPTVYQTSIAFRENWLWFIVMPGFWWQGFMIYFGLLEQVLLANVVIGAHNVLLHNSSTRDEKLYHNKYTKTFMKYFEYIINTPALHRGHHGLGKNGVPFGNYAQTLFIWDVIFGTAVFNKGAVPEYYAVSNPTIMKQSWYYHLWWPFVKQKK